MQLSLDHISVTDTTPSQLARLAAATGCSGICPFLHAMEVLPAMPRYDLVADVTERRATRALIDDLGLSVDLVYPFTLAGRTIVADFAPVLEAAADLGAPLANILCYDRDPARRVEKLSELAELAAPYGIALGIEFYPSSQIRTLAEALALIEATGSDSIGVVLDMLHLMRGGALAESVPLLGDPRIRVVQLADGPAEMAADRVEWEAGLQRLLPGEGALDFPELLAALHPDALFSVEAPRQDAIDQGVPVEQRARQAVEAARAVLRQRQ